VVENWATVHLIRNTLEYVGWKDRKALATELKGVYRAVLGTKRLVGSAQ
jgi:transposase-like protein